MVYLITTKIGTETRTKIGMVKACDYKNLERRMVNIATGSATPIEYVALLPAEGQALETMLHRQFKNERIRYTQSNGRVRCTEWFTVPPEVVMSAIGSVNITAFPNQRGWLEMERA